MAGGRNRSQYVASACSTTVHPVHEIKYQCTLPHAQCLPIVLNTCDHPRSGICSDSFFCFFLRVWNIPLIPMLLTDYTRNCNIFLSHSIRIRPYSIPHGVNISERLFFVILRGFVLQRL